MLAGTAKPIPTLPWLVPPVAICEFTPITWPAASSSGPPELPGLIGASVWITESIWKPSGAWMWRPVPETIPAVAVCGRPNGDPIATASWPVRTVSESASSSAVRPDSPVTRTIARSEERSTPRTVPVAVRSSENWTWTVSLSPTTCAFVTIVPSGSTTKPVPEPAPVRIETTAGLAAR